MISYRVLIDWNRTGAYDHAYSDVTSYVRDSLQWTYGMEYMQEFAPPARATIALNNLSGLFTPENTSSALYGLFQRGTLVKIETIVTSVTRTMFVGTITRYQIGAGVNDPIVSITIEDGMLPLLDAEYMPPLQTNVRTDQVLSAFFSSAVVPYPYPTAFAMLDISATLDTAPLFDDLITDLDTGVTTLAYAGDNAGSEEGVSAQGYLRDVITAEFGGRFFWDARAAKFVFHSRHHDALNTTTPVSIGEEDTLYSPAPPSYFYADDVANDIEVTFAPRRVDSTSRVLYTLESPRSCKASDHVTMNVRYRDPNDDRVRVGAVSIEQPGAGGAWTANTAPDGSGSDVTFQLTLTVNGGAESAEVTLYNPTGSTVYLTKLELTGIAIYTLPRDSVKARDADSIARHGLLKRVVDVPIIDTSDTAQGFANYLLLTSKTATGRLGQVSYEIGADDTRAAAILALNVGDRLNLTVSSLNITAAAYVVTGFRHVVNIATNSHLVTLMLSPAGRVAFGILDDSVRGALDTTMRIAV